MTYEARPSRDHSLSRTIIGPSGGGRVCGIKRTAEATRKISFISLGWKTCARALRLTSTRAAQRDADDVAGDSAATSSPSGLPPGRRLPCFSAIAFYSLSIISRFS